MNKKQQPLTTAQILTRAQQLTDTHIFPELDFQPAEVDERAALTEELREHRASVDKLSVPFSIYHQNLAEAEPQPVNWLWDKRLPLAGITILDGDHGCGKSLLALQIAASVSSGSCLPDGTTPIQGGVVIITPYTDSTTTQLQLLTAMGADLSRIEVLSFIKERAPEFHTGGHRPFSLPQDFIRLSSAIKRVDARLIILDPFLSLLSRDNRWTNERLGSLLADLNQRFIERNVACLLIRNCPARGGHARPSMLERTDHFPTIATSHLLLSPDPMQPDRLLLSHAKSTHAALTPTLILQIQSRPDNPDLPLIAHLGSHSLKAKDLIENRPDTLHRRLLSQHLLHIIAESTEPIPVSTLYTLSPHSSPFQIQRSLNDLLHMGQIQRPARGLYSSAPTNPTFPPNATTAKTPNPKSAKDLNGTAAKASTPKPAKKLNETAARTTIPEPEHKLNGTAARISSSEPTQDLNGTAARIASSEPAQLNGTAARISSSEPTQELNGTAARTAIPEPTQELNGTAARISSSEPTQELNGTAARISSSEPAQLNGTAARTAIPEPTQELNGTAARIASSEPAQLNGTAARTAIPEPTQELNGTAARTAIPEPTQELNGTAARTAIPEPTQELNGTAARTTSPEPTQELNGTAARTTSPEPTQELNGTAARISSSEPTQETNVAAATTPNTSPATTLKPCGNWRHALGCRCNSY